MMRLVADVVQFQLATVPSTGMMRHAARTVERPFVPDLPGNRYQVRPVLVRAEPDQISHVAFWTLNAMTDTR